MKYILSTILMIMVFISITGCNRSWESLIIAEFRSRVFELDKETGDKLIPKDKIQPVENSLYSIYIPSSMELDTLLQKTTTPPGLLSEKKAKVSFWPKSADSWAYSIADGNLLGGGTGTGFIGIRENKGNKEIRIDYDIRHSVNTGKPVESKIFYEGIMPSDHALVFLAPFERKDGTRRYHLIIFDLIDWKNIKS